MPADGVRRKTDIRGDFLQFSGHSIGEEEIREVVDTLRSNWITRGPKTAEFEDKFKEYVGCAHAIALSSCTAALHLSLVAEEIKKGDEVITTPFTFAATVDVIEHQHAKPVLVDIQEDTCNIDPDLIHQRISRRTKAIIPVDYAGHPCEYDDIDAIAEGHGLHVIADAAHSFGASYRRRKVGTLAEVNCFSFYATKNLTTGEGGMLTTDDDDLAERIRILSLHGISRDAWKRYSAEGSWKYDIIYPGYKYNMSDIQAAIGLHQLRKFDKMQKRRREIAKAYDDAFGSMKEISPPAVRQYVKHAWHLYPIKINLERLRIDRDEFIEELKAARIGTSVHFIPIHMHPFYRSKYGFRKGAFPVAESVYRRQISLPIYPRMSNYDVEYVIETIKKIVKRNRR